MQSEFFKKKRQEEEMIKINQLMAYWFLRPLIQGRYHWAKFEDKNFNLSIQHTRNIIRVRWRYFLFMYIYKDDRQTYFILCVIFLCEEISSFGWPLFPVIFVVTENNFYSESSWHKFFLPKLQLKQPTKVLLLNFMSRRNKKNFSGNYIWSTTL